MVPKEQLGRANGMMSLLDAGPGVLAPILAGVLLPIVTLTGILTIDVLTFFLAILALAIVFVPQPAKDGRGPGGAGGLLERGGVRLPLHFRAAEPAGAAAGLLLRQPVSPASPTPS